MGLTHETKRKITRIINTGASLSDLTELNRVLALRAQDLLGQRADRVANTPALVGRHVQLSWTNPRYLEGKIGEILSVDEKKRTMSVKIAPVRKYRDGQVTVPYSSVTLL